MKGLQIAKEYYQTYGLPMLKENFSEYIDRIAVGLVGEGSECLGFDDEISQDHDFEAGFCLFLTKEDYEKFGFKLERAYSRLPKEFMGLKKSYLSPVGGNRHGVIIIDDFYTKFLGRPNLPENPYEWLSLPPFALLNATNGEVFCDKLGEFSIIRDELKKGYPEDVRLKKISAHTVFMAQSGQYNYPRLIKRGELGAAQLAVYEFVKNAISVIYLLNNKYEPYYKWAYKGMDHLPVLGELKDALISLTELDNTHKNAEIKMAVIEDIASLIITEFQNQDITKAICLDLEMHAYSISDKISDVSIRNMHIMEGV